MADLSKLRDIEASYFMLQAQVASAVGINVLSALYGYSTKMSELLKMTSSDDIHELRESTVMRPIFNLDLERLQIALKNSENVVDILSPSELTSQIQLPNFISRLISLERTLLIYIVSLSRAHPYLLKTIYSVSDEIVQLIQNIESSNLAHVFADGSFKPIFSLSKNCLTDRENLKNLVFSMKTRDVNCVNYAIDTMM